MFTVVGPHQPNVRPVIASTPSIMFTRRKALTNTNFVAPDMPKCDSPRTGMAPFATHSIAAAHSVSTGVTDVRALLTLIP